MFVAIFQLLFLFNFDGYSGPEIPAWQGISPSWVPIVLVVA
jgi:hypothetical protein